MLIKRKHIKNMIILLGAILCGVLQALIIKAPNGGIIKVVTAEWNTEFNLRGILQSVMAMLCLFLVCVDYKKGMLVTYFTMGISSISLSFTIIMGKNLGSLPGVITLVLTMVSAKIISEQLKLEERNSITDVVTGLLNRRGLFHEFDARDMRKKKFHLLLVHARNMKAVNDNLGYEYGNLVVCEIAKRLKNVMGDNSVICKLDATEFAVIIPNGMDVEKTVKMILDFITRSIEIEFEGEPYHVYLDAYAGIASFPGDTTDFKTLIKYADIAMSHAGKTGQESIVFFSEGLELEMRRRAEIEKYIKEGIENNYFSLVYQPQYGVYHNLRGYEALLRLTLPDGTRISPTEFIPIAEKTDLICKIDEFVMYRAMREFKDMFERTGKRKTLSINISAREFSNRKFVGTVLDIVNKIGFPPEWLELEITEYSLYESLSQTVENITTLKSYGIRFALDDFGTGYTSLAEIIKLPFDLLKIDKSLIDEMENDAFSDDFIKLVIYMGHLIDSDVIAEGVEQESQFDKLKEYKCDFIQGFLLSKPVDYETAVKICDECAE